MVMKFYMINNYLKIAIRNLGKQKFYSIINISGLSFGLACVLLITIFVIDELSYDKFHQKSKRIYRIGSHLKFGGNDNLYAVAPAPLAKAVMDDIPEIEVATRFRSWGDFIVKRQDAEEGIKENGVIWSDPEIFDVFTIPFISGDVNYALSEPNTLVISESLARKYFPGEDPLNQILILDDHLTCKITGVFEDIPENSHFHFKILLAMEGLEESKNQMWLSNNFQTYFVMRQGSDPEIVEEKLNNLYYKYTGPQVLQFMGMTVEELFEKGTKAELFLQPLEKIHLYSDLVVEFEPNGDIKYVYIFSAIALFILILAIVNFMNLSTARSADRAKEVGIRKVMGSYRIYLIRQFLVESILFTFISILLAIFFAQTILPYFNDLSGKNLQIPYNVPTFWLAILSGTFLIGILAGIYPALFLSSFKPIIILQGKLASGAKGSFIRSVLVVFQFTISIILIIGTIGVYNQLNYIQNKKLGFEKDQVIILRDSFVLGDQIESFKNEIVSLEHIEMGTISGFLPVSNSNRNNTSLWKKGDRSPESTVNMQKWSVDYDYIPTLNMNMVLGRAFSKEFPSDSNAIILNEQAARLFGYEDPIGQEIQTFAFSSNNSIDESKIQTFRIIGVVENFHFESLKENIGALCMVLSESNGLISFKYDASYTSNVINELQAKWKTMVPGQPFQYTFLDDEFGNMYESEQKTGKIFSTFALLAILIASLGLFALAAFMTEQRTKEIGVRKVMGATMGNIIFLLSKDFSKLVIIAFIISIPIAWYGIRIWLQGFAYKDIPGIPIYLGAGITALIIAWLTVSYQSIKAASTNPAKSLRDE